LRWRRGEISEERRPYLKKYYGAIKADMPAMHLLASKSYSLARGASNL